MLTRSKASKQENAHQPTKDESESVAAQLVELKGLKKKSKEKGTEKDELQTGKSKQAKRKVQDGEAEIENAPNGSTKRSDKKAQSDKKKSRKVLSAIPALVSPELGHSSSHSTSCLQKGGEGNKGDQEEGSDSQLLSDTLFSKTELENALLSFERQEGYGDGNDGNTDIGEFGFNALRHRDVLKQREVVYLPKANYLTWHPGLTPKTRLILFSWLIEVAEEFKFQRETLHMAFNFVDRFLSVVPKVCRSKFQLIGISALFIACKIEEQVWPTLATLTHLTDGACSIPDVLNMEKLVLQKLTWHLLPITPNMFLRLYLYILISHNVEVDPDNLINSSMYNKNNPNNTANNNNVPRKNIPENCLLLVKFPKREYVFMMNIIDTAAMDYESANFTPSAIAAAVLYTAYLTDFNKIEYVTGYTPALLTPCIEWITPFLCVPPPKAYISPVELLPSDFYNYQISNPVSKQFVESYL